MGNSILFFLLLSASRLSAQQKTFKFDFGTERTADGYIAITPASRYNEEKGYGFSHGSEPESVDRGGDPLKGDYITAKKPLYFSVRLPEGNYYVDLLLGDTKGRSATTVRVECRRLMLENIRTNRGELKPIGFAVHIRDSLIRNGEGEMVDRVRLKPRERGYLHWDNLLTIELNDSLLKVCSMIIVPLKNSTTIFLAGNSTVVDQDREPWAAWGQMFPRFFRSMNVAVANYAESGESLLAFKREKRLDKIWSLAKPGDYLLIEFAHNDQKTGGNHLDPFTTYQQTLKEWIAEARKRAIIPVLVTSMHRRNFDSSGHIINTLLDYPEAMRQTAREEKVALIDLNAMSKTLYEAWGPEASLKAFVHYPANTFPNQPEALKDNTHFSPYGAHELAKCVVESIRAQQLPLAEWLLPGLSPYDPSKPLAFDQFYWPASSFVTGSKPDGN